MKFKLKSLSDLSGCWLEVRHYLPTVNDHKFYYCYTIEINRHNLKYSLYFELTTEKPDGSLEGEQILLSDKLESIEGAKRKARKHLRKMLNAK